MRCNPPHHVLCYSGTKYSVEELLAMIMESARNYASVFAEQKVSDAVIICPAHFNQAERRSLKRAAEMAGIKVLQLMNTHAAGKLSQYYSID